MTDEQNTKFIKGKIAHGKSDEYFTPIEAVEYIVPYAKQFDKPIWCPFDFENSNFIKIFNANGIETIATHIEGGYDFFEYEPPKDSYSAIISNPPYSKRNEILERLFALNKPFAMLLNFSGLWDNLKRYNLFKTYGIELLIPPKRVQYISRYSQVLTQPMFKSVYVCHNILPNLITYC